MEIEELIDKLMEELGPRYLQGCYTVAKIISEILTCETKIVFVQGAVENAKAKEFREIYGFKSWMDPPSCFTNEDIWDKGAFTLGIGVGRDPNGKPCFHSIVWLLDTNMIIDATMAQFTRPDYGMHFKAFYGPYLDYRQLYVDFQLVDWEEEMLKIFQPAIIREPEKFKDIIERYREM